MPIPAEMVQRAADAAFDEMEDRGLLNGVGDDLFDEIKTAVATAALTAALGDTHVMVPKEAPWPAIYAAHDAKIYLNMTDPGWALAYKVMVNAAAQPGEDVTADKKSALYTSCLNPSSPGSQG